MQSKPIPQWWDSITNAGTAFINRVRYGSIMDTILVLVTLVTTPCLITYYFTRFWPLVLIAALPIVYFFYVYDFFMKNNPQMLRTEKHEETMLRIGMGSKDNELPETSIDAQIATPANKASLATKPKLLSAQRKRGNHE